MKGRSVTGEGGPGVGPSTTRARFGVANSPGVKMLFLNLSALFKRSEIEFLSSGMIVFLSQVLA